MKVVITGGAGFIGSHLAASFAGEEVHVLDDLSRGRLDRLARDVHVHQGSVLDGDLVRRVVEGADQVYHLAAQVSVPESVEQPRASFATNATGTLEVLEACRRADVDAFVLASSAAVYGDAHQPPLDETMAPHPQSPYAASKAAAEAAVGAYHASYGLHAAVVRYFNVYGPDQDARGGYAAVVPAFLRAASQGAPLTIHGDGRQTRDFIHVADVVDATRRVGACPAAADAPVNVASGQAVTVLQLADAVLHATGSSSPVQHAEPRPGDVRHSHAATGRAQRLLASPPARSLDEGIAATAAWWRDHLSTVPR